MIAKLGTLAAVLTLAGGAFTWLHSLTADCTRISIEAINRQDMLRREIRSRREKFVEEVRSAHTMQELRQHISHRDALHGFRYKAFENLSLGELEDEEQINGKHMDMPSFFALDLRLEFMNARTSAILHNALTGDDSRGDKVWTALEVQDVSSLANDDLKDLQQAANIESGWFLREYTMESKEGLPTEACSLGQTLADLLHDGRPVVHVTYSGFLKQ